MVALFKREAATEVAAPPSPKTGITAVDSLLAEFNPSRFGPEPSHDQIAAAIHECASLTVDKWASARKHLLKICPDDLKATDLNRMFNEARKAIQRDQRVTAPPERYYELDGAMMVVRQTDKGQVERAVCNWTAKIVEERTWIDPDEDAMHEIVVELMAGNKVRKINLPTEILGDEVALKRKLAAMGGATFTLNRGMTGDLVPAIRALSPEYDRRLGVNTTGWQTINGELMYVTPTLSVSANGIVENAPSCELPARINGYGLIDGELREGMRALGAMADALPPTHAAALIGFALAPLIQPLLPASISKPALHLIGTTGSGKSEIAAMMCCLYGHFTRDEPPAQWGDTVNTVELLGWHTKNALYWADDYKDMYADERTFTRFLQAYSRGMGRGRLTRDAKLRKEKPTRGHLLSTGETIMHGEASVLSRMLILEIPPWEARDKGGYLFAEANQVRGDLPIFTRHLIQWIASHEGALKRELLTLYNETTKHYRVKLESLSKQANTGRMIQNWAVLGVSYYVAKKFLAEHQRKEVLPDWSDSLLESIQTVQAERAGTIFLDVLTQLIDSGKAHLDNDLKMDSITSPGQVRVGWWPKDDRSFVYLIPDVAYGVVNVLVEMSFSKQAIAGQLAEDRILIAGTEDRYTTRIRIDNRQTRVWKLKADFLNADNSTQKPF